ncbi:hydrolase 1, exosortase A system-associated [Massilia psychrophila]|uniref:Hydrolase 1, exosortase A system-associated n=2 Tax=Massilia psychrophila TaxID=1603353 RepID=A0A2G8T124_9BURK|nr:hydrolase 1, exosortase A system-associated [Massilia psychrophila]GGE87171.1 hydrolase 1, exosortase A system-associated [Massilia psychrophila]
MNYEEQAITFDCHGASLYGIASVPQQSGARGVLIVVGGPQYRVGSHRQFALLARSLASQGIPAMRFDYRGMGDSVGEPRTFEEVGPDLRAAIDHFIVTVPGMQEVVIWGLCDAAAAALFYGAEDARVCGLVLLNPWVRTSGGHAKATLKHYYLERLLQPALWRKIVSGRFNYRGALRSLASVAGAAAKPAATGSGVGHAAAADAPLPDRMLAGLANFKGKVLLILSGRDLTAREFSDLAKGSAKWQRLLGASRVTRHALDEADHTFSRRVWRDQVSTWTGDWIKSW